MTFPIVSLYSKFDAFILCTNNPNKIFNQIPCPADNVTARSCLCLSLVSQHLNPAGFLYYTIMNNLTSIYRQAPELLLDKLAEVNAVLAKQDKNSKSYKFWKGVADVMKFSFGYMNDFHPIIRENEVLRAENKFLKHYTADLTNRLSAFETIVSLKKSGIFDETIAKVDEYLQNEHNLTDHG